MKFKESETNKMQIMSTLGWCAATLIFNLRYYVFTNQPGNIYITWNKRHVFFCIMRSMNWAMQYLLLFMGKFKSISIGLTANTSRIRIEKLDTKEDFVVGLGGPFANVIIPPAVCAFDGKS